MNNILVFQDDMSFSAPIDKIAIIGSLRDVTSLESAKVIFQEQIVSSQYLRILKQIPLRLLNFRVKTVIVLILC